MFGYIRPLVGEMRVCENEFYRALYCGLCRAMGHHTGCASRMTLSYDFVFLCAFRAAVTGVNFTAESHRCAVHPIKKRAMTADNEVFSYAARAAAILNAAKLADDMADESGKKRAAAKLLSPAARAIRRKVTGMETLEDAVTHSLSNLAALEKAGCASIDETAETFGDLLGQVFAHELTGSDARTAGAVGHAVGRFIYVIDAADDAADDSESGAYNPILRLYASDTDSRPILEKRTVSDRSGHTVEKMCLRTDIAESIYTAALNNLFKLEKTLELIDFSRCQSETAGIVKNIAYLGMPAELRRVLALP